MPQYVAEELSLFKQNTLSHELSAPSHIFISSNQKCALGLDEEPSLNLVRVGVGLLVSLAIRYWDEPFLTPSRPVLACAADS